MTTLQTPIPEILDSEQHSTNGGPHHFAAASVANDAEVFSTFSTRQKRWIVFLTAFAGLFSPMSSFIFYPAINSISASLKVTVGLVNLAITTYMVVSGIAPTLIGNAADHSGRRPTYMMALSIYCTANIGLALQSSFPALLLLRMLQSAGSSGMVQVKILIELYFLDN